MMIFNKIIKFEIIKGGVNYHGHKAKVLKQTFLFLNTKRMNSSAKLFWRLYFYNKVGGWICFSFSIR